MQYKKVIYETGPNFVAEITMNRPHKRNAFDTTMAAELDDALKFADTEGNVRVILLKGAGNAFCVGIDINELGNHSTMAYLEWIELMERPLQTIASMKKPVIAQVQGVAVANGMGLAMAADLTIASENVRMGLTAINVGLNCVGPVLPVAKTLGRKKTLELLFYGNLISAVEAHQLGLINRVVPRNDLESAARDWAEELAQKSPIALQVAKSAFYNSEDMEYDKQFAYMNEAFARLCSTEDAKEGISAFFQKRKPDWKNR